MKNGKFIFTTDTIALKNSFTNIIEMTDVKLEKIEILKDKTFGEKQEDFYMVIAYDRHKELKIARWLVKDRDSLFYYKPIKLEEITDEEIFYRSYYVCHGSNDDCFPHVAYIDGQRMWGSSEKLICEPDSPCKGIVSFQLYGE